MKDLPSCITNGVTHSLAVGLKNEDDLSNASNWFNGNKRVNLLLILKNEMLFLYSYIT